MPPKREAPAMAERRSRRRRRRDGLCRQRPALHQPQRQIGHGNRDDRRQAELPEPCRQMRHAAGEHHQVGRIGNGQHEARRIGNEGADQQIRQRRCAGGPGRGIDGGREHDGGRVVRKQHRDHGADRVNQRKQPLRRAARVLQRRAPQANRRRLPGAPPRRSASCRQGSSKRRGRCGCRTRRPSTATGRTRPARPHRPPPRWLPAGETAAQ